MSYTVGWCSHPEKCTTRTQGSAPIEPTPLPRGTGWSADIIPTVCCAHGRLQHHTTRLVSTRVVDSHGTSPTLLYFTGVWWRKSLSAPARCIYFSSTARLNCGTIVCSDVHRGNAYPLSIICWWVRLIRVACILLCVMSCAWAICLQWWIPDRAQLLTLDS